MAIRNEKQSEESGGLGDALSRSTKYGRAIIPMFYDDGIRFVGIMRHAVAVEEFIAEHPVTASSVHRKLVARPCGFLVTGSIVPMGKSAFEYKRTHRLCSSEVLRGLRCATSVPYTLSPCALNRFIQHQSRLLPCGLDCR